MESWSDNETARESVFFIFDFESIFKSDLIF